MEGGDKALSYFKDLFDKVLQRDPESEQLFKELILKHGTKTIYNLTTVLEYKESRQIHERAFRVCISALFDVARDDKQVEIVFGCRHPRSKGDGYWDGAFVVLKEKNGECYKCFLFQDGQDDVDEVQTIKEAMMRYSKYKKLKWTPMSDDDIMRTTGIVLDEKTLRLPPSAPKRHVKIVTGVGLAIFLVAVLKNE